MSATSASSASTRSGEEFYQITLGGERRPRRRRSATSSAPAFSYDEVVDAVETIVDTYVSVRRERRRSLQRDLCPGRALQPFKETLYGAH